MSEVEEAARISKMHQAWILQTLEDEGGCCKYEKLVEVGEEHECDTVGAMLKILKKRKKIRYDRPFLMYPHHKNDIIALKSYKGSKASTKKTKRKGKKKKKKKVPVAEAEAPATEAEAARRELLTAAAEEATAQEEAAKAAAKAAAEAAVAEAEAEAAAAPALPRAGADSSEELAETTAAVEAVTISAGSTFTYDQLKSPGPYPEGVDASKRESYLSDKEFEDVLKMKRADFDKLATWKKNKAKRAHGLF